MWLLLSAAIPSFAYDFQAGNLCYNITSDSTAEVTYQEYNSSDNYSELTSAVIPESVTYDGTTYRVTSIGDYTFYGCSGLTSVTIPNSVTSIGKWAFSYCRGLTSVTIPDGVTSIGEFAFGACSGLTSVTIPNSVTSIGSSAFLYCSGLTSVTIPNSVTSIGDRAFGFVPNIVYSGTATGAPWGARGMNGYIDGYLIYADSTKTTLLACYNTVTGAITIPDGVTTIGESAFYDCSGLKSVTIGNSVTSIGNDAFCDCTGLTSITILDGVTTIGTYAFFSCTSLTSVSIPNSVTTIEGYAFHNTPWFDNLPDGVVYINRVLYAYKGTMPQRTSIVVKEGTTCISGSAFYGCHSLTSITIPNSVMTIGWAAFYDCTGLESVTCQAMEPPFAFLPFSSVGISSIPLYVPVESIDKYAAADVWKDFMEIKAISATPAEVNEPILTPDENKVAITWPAVEDAIAYTIEISNDSALVCTLVFDASGALKNMHYAAPARYAAQYTTQAEATGYGFRFVVEGLDYATTYTYAITATDKDDIVLTTYSGTFTTKTPTGTEDILSSPSQPTTRKVFHNGQVYILRGDKTYNINGTEVK